MTSSIKIENDYTVIVKALLSSGQGFFTAGQFSEATGVNIRDANRIIAELESKGILELYNHESKQASLMWELKKAIAESYIEKH